MIPLAVQEATSSSIGGHAQPVVADTANPPSATTHHTATNSGVSAPRSSSRPHPGDTGNSLYLSIAVPKRKDGHCIASYAPGGTAASAYVACNTDAFHCDILPSADVLYVTVWTR
jgi:hypothetical protein